MVDATVSKQQAGGGMPLSEHLLRESHAFIAALGSGEGQVLASGEISRMGGYEIQETSLVLGVAEAAEVLDAGFRKVHGSQTQNGGHDLPVVAHSAQTSCVLRPGVDLKPGAGLFR